MNNIIEKKQKSNLKLNQLQREALANFIEKNYEYEEINCPICNSNNFIVLAQKDRYSLDNQTVLCENCGLVYTNPRLTQKSYNKFYDSEYRQLYVGSEKPSEKFFNDQCKHGKKIYDYIFSHCNIPNNGLNILEIGCGAGGILAFFRDKSHSILGVDLGKEYLKFGREMKNLNLIEGTIENVPVDFKPDIIIYSHVFEHILNLKQELKTLHNICNPETLIYIEVPGIKNVHKQYQMNFMNYFQNAHTCNFSMTTLKNIFETAGFEMIKGNEYIKCLFRVNSESAKTTIENDFDNISEYIKKVIKKQKYYSISITNIRYKTLKTIGKILELLRLKSFVKKILE